MDKNQFAETIKQKYPQYKDMDNTMLADKMIEKYPEYASKITVQTPETVPTKDVGIVRKIAGSIVKPFERLASSGIEYGSSGVAYGLDKLLGTGVYKDYADARTKMNNPYSGDKSLTYAIGGDTVEPVKSVKDLAGTTLEAGANFIPVGKVGIGLKSILSGAKLGAKTGAVVGLGSSLQEEDSTIGDNVADTFKGAGFGGLLGGGISGVARIPSGVNKLRRLPETLNDSIVESRVPEEIRTILNPSKNIEKAKLGNIEFTVPNIEGEMVDGKVPQMIKRKAEDLLPSEKFSLAEETSDKYTKYVQEAKRSVANRENATPLQGSVAKRISDEVDKVDLMRRNIGKRMGEVEKEFGDVAGDLSDEVKARVDDIENYLADFDMLGIKNTETSQLARFIENIDSLKNEPSVANRNRIIRNWQTVIEDARDATTGKMSYAYTQMNNVLRKLKEDTRSLIPDETYQTMIKSYGNLSRFDEEASKLMGGETVLGNAKRGASVAKRAVQSLTDGGARDLLIRLKEITGYNGIQDAQIAIQAMKDAGDFQQASLLENTMKGLQGDLKVSAPSKTGFIDKGLDLTLGKALRYGRDKLVGDPVERVNKYIKDAQKGASKSRGATKLPYTTAKSGSIDDIITENKPKVNAVRPVVVDKYGTPSHPDGRTLVDPSEGAIYYHGTVGENKPSLLKEGFNPSSNKKGFAEQPEAFYIGSYDTASMYGNDMVGVRVKKGAKVNTLQMSSQEWADTVGKSMNSKETAEALREIRARGYDAVNAGNEIEILNPSKFEIFDVKKEKSLYEQVTGKKPEDFKKN